MIRSIQVNIVMLSLESNSKYIYAAISESTYACSGGGGVRPLYTNSQNLASI